MEKYKSKLVLIIKKYLPTCRIYLFGSRAKLINRHGSDIDLALDLGQKIERIKIINIIEEIENSDIPFCVDVVDFYSVDKDMQEQIIHERVLWN